MVPPPALTPDLMTTRIFFMRSLLSQISIAVGIGRKKRFGTNIRLLVTNVGGAVAKGPMRWEASFVS